MGQQLELAQMIKSLRAELKQAQSDGADESIRFAVEEVEMELEIVADEQINGGMAAKFYVLTSQFKASHKKAVTQKLKLKLKPVEEVEDKETGVKSSVPAKISGTVSD